MPATTSASRFPARPCGATSCVVPRGLASAGSSSPELGLLFRVRASSNLPRARMSGAPSLGFRLPIAASVPGIHLRARSHPRPTVRPRRFSRPRRLTPPRTWWACFIPQPRPGFASQGFFPTAKPERLVDVPCPRVVARRFLSRVASRRQLRRPRLQGLVPGGDPRLPARRLTSTKPDPLTGFPSSGSLSEHLGPAFTVPPSSTVSRQVLRVALASGPRRIAGCSARSSIPR